jgi:hypothetical protein
MAKPHTPGGAHGDGPSPSHPDGDGDGGVPRQRRGSTDVPDNVGRAQETIAEEARQGRPGGDQGGSPGRPGGGDDTFQSPARGTPEYERRMEELSHDPAHGGRVSKKSTREAEVGLAAEAAGSIPGPIRRAELDNTDPAFQRDQGDFVDANGDIWDVKIAIDTFPDGSGPMGGQPMPEGTRGRYAGDDFEQKLVDEVNGGQGVIIDDQNLSPSALADLKRRVAGNPDLDGKVVFLE